MPNVSSSSREPRPGGSPCVPCGRPSLPPRFFRRFFFEQMSSAFRSVPGVFYPGSCLRSSDVLGVHHSHHASTSPSSTLLLTRVYALRAFLLSSLRVPRFPRRRRRTNFAWLPQETVPLYLLRCIKPPVGAVGRLARSGGNIDFSVIISVGHLPNRGIRSPFRIPFFYLYLVGYHWFVYSGC